MTERAHALTGSTGTGAPSLQRPLHRTPLVSGLNHMIECVHGHTHNQADVHQPATCMGFTETGHGVPYWTFTPAGFTLMHVPSAPQSLQALDRLA